MELTIERSKWATGKDGGLLLDGEKMCCLGFLCRAIGYESAEILMMAMPEEVTQSETKPLPLWLLEPYKVTSVSERPDVYQAARDNDDTTISSVERERRVTEIFAKHDIQVRFVD